jgi:hypothetical protein
MKSKDLVWKAKDQKCGVIINVGGETYQVCLNQEQMNSILFILPQLFDDNKIKVYEEALPLTLTSLKKQK